MRALLWSLVATSFLFGMSASLKASDYIVFQEGNCFYDSTVPETGEDLVANTQLSLNGDCSIFEIWAAPYNPDGFDEEAAVIIPRSAQFDWHQCRFQNVLTQLKIEEYVYPFIDPEEEKGAVTFQGRCIADDEYTGFDERVYEVEIPH